MNFNSSDNEKAPTFKEIIRDERVKKMITEANSKLLSPDKKKPVLNQQSSPIIKVKFDLPSNDPSVRDLADIDEFVGLPSTPPIEVARPSLKNLMVPTDNIKEKRKMSGLR
jgi:hypothetical protein